MEIIWYLIKYTIFLPWIIWVIIITLIVGGVWGEILGHATAAVLYSLILIKIFGEN